MRSRRRTSCFILLLIGSVSGRRFSLPFGAGNKGGSSSQYDDYEYYSEYEYSEDNDDATSGVGKLVAGVSLGAAACIGGGLLALRRMGPVRRSTTKTAKRRVLQRAASDEGSLGEESLSEMAIPETKPAVTADSPKKTSAAPASPSLQTQTKGPAVEPISLSDDDDTLVGLARLLGPTLLKASENGTRLESVNSTEAVGDKVVALYLSSHSIEMELRDRNLTKSLLRTHVEGVARRVQDNGNAFEVVYVSLDPDAKTFRDVARSISFPSMLLDEGRRTRLFKHLGTIEAPNVVILDKDGEVLNRAALGPLLSEPQSFPWRAKTLKELLDDPTASLLRPDGSEVDAPSALSGKKVGLYFSAHWCQPCKQFTPVLMETYGEVRQHGADHDFEVLFVSHDRDEDAFLEYRKDMPWLSIPFNANLRSQLQTALQVNGLPTLVILDEERNVITEDGRGEVTNDPMGLEFPWHPKIVKDMSVSHEGLLEHPSVVLLLDESTQALEAAQFTEALTTAAAAALTADGEPADLKFFVAKTACQAKTAVQQLLGIAEDEGDELNILGDTSTPPTLVLVDLPQQSFFRLPVSTDLDEESMLDFITSALSGSIEPYSLVMDA